MMGSARTHWDGGVVHTTSAWMMAYYGTKLALLSLFGIA